MHFTLDIATVVVTATATATVTSINCLQQATSNKQRCNKQQLESRSSDNQLHQQLEFVITRQRQAAPINLTEYFIVQFFLSCFD